MRYVNIHEVGMENYGPYLDPMVLKFKNDSLILITGPNGIGKTMSLDAIPYTLYGITSKGMKGDDVVNNKVGKNCKTWVKFNINSDEYLITRYRKYTKLNNTVILTKNGVDIKKGHSEVLPEVEKLICSKKSFVNTLMFGQKVKDFFTDLVDSDKKLIFREILMLELYQSYYKLADDRLKEVKDKISQVEKQIDVDKGLMEDAENQILILKAAKKKFEDEKQIVINDFKKSIDTSTRLLNEWKKKLEEIKDSEVDVEIIEKQMDDIKREIDRVNSELEKELKSIDQKKSEKLFDINNKANEVKSKIKDQYQKQYDEKSDKISELKDTLNDLVLTAQQRRHKGELGIQKVEANVSHLRIHIEKIKSNVLDLKNEDVAECPLCKQKVTDETIEVLNDEVVNSENIISLEQSRIEKAKNKIKDIDLELKKGSDELVKFIDDIRNENKDLKEKEKLELQNLQVRLNDTIQKVETLVEDQKKDIKENFIKTKNELTEKYKELDKKKVEYKNIEDERFKIEQTIVNITNEITQISFKVNEKEKEEYDMNQLNSYQKRLFDLNEKISNLTSDCKLLESKVKILDFWKTGFSSSGIPSMLIDEAIPFMNEKVAYYLDKLTNGRYIVSFDTLATTKSGEFRDKISVNVIDTFTRANSRVQLSGGQTRIIDIATILTLGGLQENIQGMSINILLFDEIFDSLDEENIGYVSQVLNKLKFGKSICLISHRHEDQLEPDETLTLR